MIRWPASHGASSPQPFIDGRFPRPEILRATRLRIAHVGYPTRRMSTHGLSYTRSYPAVAASVPRARTELTEFARQAGVEQERLEAIRLSASEATTNAVLHAYRDAGPEDPRPSFQVTACCVEEDLWVLIADEGTGLRPRTRSEGLGIGLVLIAQLADEFEIVNRGGGGTELRMRFELRSSGGCADRAQSRGSVASAVAPA